MKYDSKTKVALKGLGLIVGTVDKWKACVKSNGEAGSSVIEISMCRDSAEVRRTMNGKKLLINILKLTICNRRRSA
jgi:hypothetical protein